MSNSYHHQRSPVERYENDDVITNDVIGGASELILDSVKQQEILFRKITQQLEVDKKLKRRSFSVYQSSSTNRKLVENEIQHENINRRRRASSSLGLLSTSQKAKEIDAVPQSKGGEYGMEGYVTTSHSYITTPQGTKWKEGEPQYEMMTSPTYHQPHYDVTTPPPRDNMTSQSQFLFHHNYQQHVNRLIQLQYQMGYHNHPDTNQPPFHHINQPDSNQPYNDHFVGNQLPYKDVVTNRNHYDVPTPHYIKPNDYEGDKRNSKIYQLPSNNHLQNHFPSSFQPFDTPYSNHNNHLPHNNHHSSPLHNSSGSNGGKGGTIQHSPSYHHSTNSSPKYQQHANNIKRRATTSDGLFIHDNSVSVKINELIDRLQDSTSCHQTISNTTAYIQHLSYGDDVMKSILRRKGVIPILIKLLHHQSIDIQKNACGAIRNIIYGKLNIEGKMVFGKHGGISALCHLLQYSSDIELKEIITGVLWNLSSCDQLKSKVSQIALNVLASDIIIKYVCIIEPDKMYSFNRHHNNQYDVTNTSFNTSDVTIQPYWSTLFINATGCLRNISSGSPEVRQKLRNFNGLIEALLLVLENVIGKNDIDCKGVENCTCILRNLSYHLAVETDVTNLPQDGAVYHSNDNNSNNNSTKSDDCWRKYRKNKQQDKKKNNNPETLSLLMTTTDDMKGIELLSHPSVVRRYLAILSETCNNETLEAAAGALQNISAGNYNWSSNIRTAVRKVKGLPMLVEFLNIKNDKIITVICSTLRNMTIDERNQQLIGKHAMVDIIRLLPQIDENQLQIPSEMIVTSSLHHHITTSLSHDRLYATLQIIKQLITNCCDNAIYLLTLGGVPALIYINQNHDNSFQQRSVRITGKILREIWTEYKPFRTMVKKDKGKWLKNYFQSTIHHIKSDTDVKHDLTVSSSNDTTTFSGLHLHQTSDGSPQHQGSCQPPRYNLQHNNQQQHIKHSTSYNGNHHSTPINNQQQPAVVASNHHDNQHHHSNHHHMLHPGGNPHPHHHRGNPQPPPHNHRYNSGMMMTSLPNPTMTSQHMLQRHQKIQQKTRLDSWV